MVRIPAEVTNERREQVWFLMLKGHSPKSIKKTLNIPNPTVYKDIKFLTKKSKQYVYDMAKGTHVLMYQKAIEGISLALTEAWNKFVDPKTPERLKVSYLRLIGEFNELIIHITANGPTVMGIVDLRRRIDRLGIENGKPAELSEQQQIRNYISSRYDKSDFADGVNVVTSLNESESKDEIKNNKKNDDLNQFSSSNNNWQE